MAPIIQKRFFESQPNNNVGKFTPTHGQNVIRFIIPPIGNAYFELVVKANLRMNRGTAAYLPADIKDNSATAADFSHDNVAGSAPVADFILIKLIDFTCAIHSNSSMNRSTKHIILS